MATYIYHLAIAAFLDDEVADDLQPYIADHDDCACQDCQIFDHLLIFEAEFNLFLSDKFEGISEDRLSVYNFKAHQTTELPRTSTVNIAVDHSVEEEFLKIAK